MDGLSIWECGDQKARFHYSHQIGKEAYKEAVFKEIGSSFDASG
jgi:hypothetical protein